MTASSTAVLSQFLPCNIHDNAMTLPAFSSIRQSSPLTGQVSVNAGIRSRYYQLLTDATGRFGMTVAAGGLVPSIATLVM